MRFFWALSIGVFAGTVSAVAQEYPVKPVRFIVPYTPGGAADILARAVGAEIQAEEAITGLEPLIVADHRRQDEFIGDVVFVACGHSAHRVRRMLALAENHGVIGFFENQPNVDIVGDLEAGAVHRRPIRGVGSGRGGSEARSYRAAQRP